MEWVRNLLRTEDGDKFFGPVRAEEALAAATAQPGQAGPAVPTGTPVAPESGYLSLYLEAMRVSAVRDRGQAFYGSVASTCGIESHSGRAELLAVTTPAALRGVDPRHLDRVVTATVPLIDAVPYRGGAVHVQLGLFALPESFLVGPYLDFLGEVAAVTSVFLPPAGALASAALLPPLRKGLDQLLGAAAGAKLEVGLMHAWDPPVTGHYAVVRAPAPPGGFSAGPGGKLRNPDGTEVSAPYLVLRLEARPERYNWRAIPDVAAAYGTVKTAVQSGDFKAVSWSLEAFRRTALFSPDLLAEDGKRLCREVERQAGLALPATATGALARPAGAGEAGQAPAFPDLAGIDLYPGR
jgi:hypothetical protein